MGGQDLDGVQREASTGSPHILGNALPSWSPAGGGGGGGM